MDDVTRILSDLVAIDSTNPDLVPGAVGEGAIAAHIARWLESAGLEVRLHESAPGRPNVVGIARGSGGGKTLLLNGHMDTVATGGMPRPHQPEVRDGKLYGRGAYDMKGGLTACLLAAARAKQLNLRGDVIVSAVVDEEFAGLGTMTVAEQYRADGAIVAEPTHLDLIVAHKGFVWLEVETQGVAAHGSQPQLGVDAIVKMGHVLTSLEGLQQTLQTRMPHALLGHGSLHASLIEGGQELSTYPARCVLSIERRMLPGESPADVEAELREIVERRQAADPAFKAVVRSGISRAPLETPRDAGIVQAVRSAGTSVLGQPPELAGVAYWTDAATLWAVGIPAVLFGPSGGGAHADEEWVELDSVAQCAEVFLAAARQFCA